MFPLRDNTQLARFPYVTVVLVTLNALAYLLSLSRAGNSTFVFADLLHLAVNTLFLAIFGPAVEDALGRVRFPVFCLLGGLAALGAQALLDPGSSAPTLFAAGAISAVLGGYALLHPRGRVIGLVLLPFYVTIVEVPAPYLLCLWFLIQLLLGLAGLTEPDSASRLAWSALLGGFVFGLAFVRVFATPTATPTP